MIVYLGLTLVHGGLNDAGNVFDVLADLLVRHGCHTLGHDLHHWQLLHQLIHIPQYLPIPALAHNALADVGYPVVAAFP